ncbi:MAG: cation-transporting P-type ATPase [Desulfurococcaceae archaeon]
MHSTSGKWHSLSIEEIVKILDTDVSNGLSDSEAKRRINVFGRNEIVVKTKNPVEMFIKQFKNILLIILMIATVISAILGEVIDALIIISMVFIMAFFSFVQEYRSEKTIQELKKLSIPKCRVIRNSVEQEIYSTELVPGDIVLLREGDRVPADIRLVDTMDLLVDESPLTGESNPVEKDPGIVLDESTPVSDRVNMVFMGTYIVKGSGKGIVVSTGLNTELGKIAKTIAESREEKTPLEIELNEFGKRIGFIIIGVTFIVFAVMLVNSKVNVFHAFMIAIALAVAAIPEGLPAIATAILAIGAYRMAKKNALIRKLSAIETLGSVDIICTDKTGTITKGEMTVKVIKMLDNECTVEGVGYEPTGKISCREGLPNDLLEYLAAHTYTDAKLVIENNNWKIIGSPTEGSAMVLAYKGLGVKGVENAVNKLRVVKIYPFDRFRKRKSTVHEFNGKYLIVSTGAPDVLIEISSSVFINNSFREIDSDFRNKLLKIVEDLASQGYRTFGVAFKVIDKFNGNEDVSEIEKDLVFYAVLGIIDPPREGVYEAVQLARKAGVKTVMVTGDHKLTAIAVAKMIGLDVENGLVIEGRELDKMSDTELERIIDKIVVYARVTPEHKARIVKILKKRGFRVAMTGDGVNDAPAMKEAHIGVAMGVRGTDVAKEASHLILLDDNYSTIVEAIREGRVIYENLKKPINYLLTSNMGEIALIFGSQILGLPPPLEPEHLLWINIVTDSLPATALGVEPPEPDTMEKPPRPIYERIITKRKMIYYIVMGSILALVTLAVFNIYIDRSIEYAKTTAFTAIVLSEFGRALSCRSETKHFWKLVRNKWLIPALLSSLIIHLSAIYTPINEFFNTTPLDIQTWMVISATPLAIILADEIRKKLGIKI